MPTYAYVCTDCGHEFDIVQAMTDDALTTCPECQGVLRKVFHPVGVAFKGTGFYRTDSRTGSGADGAKHAAAASEGGGAADKGAASKESGPKDSGSGGSGSKDSGSGGSPSKESSAGSKSSSSKSSGSSGGSSSGGSTSSS